VKPPPETIRTTQAFGSAGNSIFKSARTGMERAPGTAFNCDRRGNISTDGDGVWAYPVVAVHEVKNRIRMMENLFLPSRKIRLL
jgi:hypothetical protein